MMIELNQKLFSPRQPYIVERRTEAVFFSPETGVGVLVNSSGRAALRAIRPSDTPLRLASELARRLRRPQAEILAALIPFLQVMISSGYLWLNDSPHETSGPHSYNTEFHPIQLYIHLTHDCNLSCLYCFNREYRQGLRCPELADSELVRVLAEAQSCGIREVLFTGGAPLLRGVGSYRRTLRGLQKLCGSKPEAVCLRPVVTRINVQSLSEMPEWAARNLGVKMILPTWYLPNSLAEVDELALFVGKESRHFLQAFADAAKTTGITNILDCIPFTTRGKCGAGSQIVSIDATGEVFPCQALHFSELSAGNVRNQSLKELGQAPAMRGMAEITVSSIAHCHDCGLAMVCGGGCRALAFALYRDIHAHNEFLCSIDRKS